MVENSTVRTGPWTDAVEYWLAQFERRDRSDANLLLSAIKNVGADEFQEEMIQLIRSRVESGDTPVGLFVETERRHRKGKAHRLFFEPRLKHRRASGHGPGIIKPSRTVDPEVGSEGLIANIVTTVVRQCRKNATIHPGPDLIRSRQIRRFILVTDFIGSGKRATRYLDAAWQVRSVRSWWSARRKKGLSFEVLAYSATEAGLRKVKSHPTMPRVKVVEGCPTIEHSFEDFDVRCRLRELCRKYGSGIRNFDPLGYGGAEALISFAHGMPNNAPAIFHKSSSSASKPWLPLYPKRITAGRGTSGLKYAKQKDAIQLDLLRRMKKNVLTSESYLSSPTALRDAVMVLLSLDRAPRNETVISARTGLSISRVQDALTRIRTYGWVDGRCRITNRGRRELGRLNVPAKKSVQRGPVGVYIPRSLRAPRAV